MIMHLPLHHPHTNTTCIYTYTHIILYQCRHSEPIQSNILLGTPRGLTISPNYWCGQPPEPPTGFFRSVVTKKRRESTHARNSPFKIPSKMRACADSRRFFVTTDLKIPVNYIMVYEKCIWPGDHYSAINNSVPYIAYKFMYHYLNTMYEAFCVASRLILDTC